MGQCADLAEQSEPAAWPAPVDKHDGNEHLVLALLAEAGTHLLNNIAYFLDQLSSTTFELADAFATLLAQRHHDWRCHLRSSTILELHANGYPLAV